VRHPGVDLDATRPPPTRVTDEHNQLVARLVVLLNLDAEVLERFEGVLPILLDGFPAAMDGRIRNLGRIVDLDLG
jgi:hypothetical protein